jgi:Response regulator containing CheY-like receiver domain and AraC-type DNA-binding domain
MGRFNMSISTFVYRSNVVKDYEYVPFMRFCYVHEGTGSASYDMQTHRFDRGTLILIPPCPLTRFRLEPSVEQPFLHSVIQIGARDFDRLTGLFPELRRFMVGLWKREHLHLVLRLATEMQIEIQRLLDEYLLEFQDESSADEEEKAVWTVELLHTIRDIVRDLVPRDEQVAGPRNENAKRMIDWIEDHYREPFSLDRMARAVHLSPYYASHLFRQEMGMTLMEHLWSRRLRESCRLLAHGNLPIHSVGKQSGFVNTAHFCKLFKARYGISPQAYRLKAGVMGVEGKVREKEH